MHDVAIIGGGLAGLALSVELSSKGYDVVLFEKNTYPFHKVCGEYIPNESVAYLNHLGANLNALGAANINQFALSTLHGNKMSSTLPVTLATVLKSLVPVVSSTIALSFSAPASATLSVIATA